MENVGERRPDGASARVRAREVFGLLDDLVGTLPVPASHKELLRLHLGAAGEDVEASAEMSAVRMPPLVHAAIAGDEGPALPVAAACTLLYLGADLLDSAIDRELPPPWRARDPAEVSLAAATLLGALPQLSLDVLREQGTSPKRLWALARLFADTTLAMNAGQHEDLLFSGTEDVSLEDSRAMVERKSGSPGALLAQAGAILATEDLSTIRAYAAFGSCCGIAKQLVNDVWGIWGAGASQDLLNGRRTFPIVHALCTLRGENRGRLRRLLADARGSADRHDEVRALLTAAGSVRYTAFVARAYHRQARNHLAVASPREPAGRELVTLLDRNSLTPQTRRAHNPVPENPDSSPAGVERQV